MKNTEIKAPWNKIYDQLGITEPSDYFEGTLYDGIDNIARAYPKLTALKFLGRSISYHQMLQNIRTTAKALSALGIGTNDCVVIALPNCPQAVYMFYAVNLIGGIAVMIHPLSAEKELEFYIKSTNAVAAVTLDQFYPKFKYLVNDNPLKTLIITGIQDELSFVKSIFYTLTEGRKINKVPAGSKVVFWKKLISDSKNHPLKTAKRQASDPAVIIFSGGTTGRAKGISLTNYNFNSYGELKNSFFPNFCLGDSVLAAMPMFHGFGLICIQLFLFCGGECILIPKFTPESYCNEIIKNRCNFIAGVPTLFEAILKVRKIENANLSFIKDVLCGGDSLSIDLRDRLSVFFQEHHASVEAREGYGASEMIAGCCLSPIGMHKKGSIGIPLRGTYMKIVQPGTDNELSYGKEGEIVVASPSVMKEYINEPEETANTIRRHADGLTWLYTGDLGMMDEEGYVYFRGRIKRMIITSGYNVYPAEIERILENFQYIKQCCVIGVPDTYKVQRVKAFIVLKSGILKNDDTKTAILEYCRKNISKYALPKEIEFRDNLPQTLIGKVDYRKLEEGSAE